MTYSFVFKIFMATASALPKFAVKDSKQPQSIISILININICHCSYTAGVSPSLVE